MKAQEVIDVLDRERNKSHWDSLDELKQASDAWKMAIEALKKQIPKKSYNSHYKQLHDEIKLHNCYRCASCDHIVPYAQNYCGHCGQAIDWTEGEG